MTILVSDVQARLEDLRIRFALRLAAYIRLAERALGRPYCRVCGCTEYAACPDGCFWAEADLCSHCEPALDFSRDLLDLNTALQPSASRWPS